MKMHPLYKILLAFTMVLLALAYVVPVFAAAGAPTNQTGGAAKGTTSTPTCNFNGASLTAGDLVVVAGAVESSSITVNSVAKSAGTGTSTGWASVVEKTGGSTVTERVFIWAGVMSASGTQTVQVTFSGSTTQSYLTCWSETGATYKVDSTQTGSGTYTSGTSKTFGLASNLIPTANDLVYVIAAYQGCGATSSPTYDQTSMSGRGTDFAGANSCGAGPVFYRLNIQDEYKLPSDATAVTGAMGISWATAITTGTWGYVEAAVDFKLQVTQPYTLTVSPGGAPQMTGTPSGCAEYQTVAGDGASHNVLSARDCSSTMTVQSGGANDRWCFASAGSCVTTQATTTCSSGTCSGASYTYYKQLQNTYQLAANGQSTFDALTSDTVTGTFLGTASSTICTIAIPGGAATYSCTAWADYNTVVTMGPVTLSGAPTGSRWARTQACTPSSTTGGNTLVCNYWKQWDQTWTAAVKTYTGSRTTFDAVMTVIVGGNQFGARVSICTITTANGDSSDSCPGSGLWIDHGATATFRGVMSSPPANERWVCASNACTNTTTTSQATVVMRYYAQLAETFTATIGAGMPNFDDALTSAAKGQVLGTASTTICTVKTYGTSSTSQACDGAFAIVQSKGITSGTSQLTSATTLGNTIIATVTADACDATPADPSVSLDVSPFAVTMTKIVGSATQTTSNTVSCTSLYEWKTFIYIASVTTASTSVSCTGSCTSAVFVEVSGTISTTADATDTNTGTGITVQLASGFTPSTSAFVIGGAGSCGMGTYSTNALTFDTSGGGSACTASSSPVVAKTGDGYLLASGGTAIQNMLTLSTSQKWALAVASFKIGATYIDYGKAATFDTDMGNAPASTKWECSTCVTATQTTGGGTPTITYWKLLSNTYQCTPQSPTTWDAIYVCKYTGQAAGVASSTIISVNTAAGGGAVSAAGYADYGATVTCTTPLGNTWVAQDACQFTDTTTGNTHNENYVQSGGSTTTTTVTTNVGDPPNLLWMLIIPFLLMAVWAVKRRL